jgi:ketosteroid isomerase-like protein
MNITTLAGPIANYIAAANTQDIEALTACFTDGAVVHDEKRDREGIAAIRKWAEEVSAKYRPTVEVLGVTRSGDTTVLAGRVSGDFPGSPIELRYAFTLTAGKIERLEIT